jgi:hypothetical protein
MFRPVNFLADAQGADVEFTWVPISNAIYVIDISRDSLLFENELFTDTVRGTYVYNISDLWSEARYSARIKAVSMNPLIKESGYKEITFVTGTENIFYSPENIETTQVLLKWIDTKEVSHIVMSVAEMDDVTIDLSDLDKISGEKLIDGLTAETNYTFKIYLGEMLRGIISLTTKASESSD